jgi:formylglycine-generating enzyme
MAGQGTQTKPPPQGAGTHPNILFSGWDSSWSSRLVVDQATLTEALNCDPAFQTWTDSPGANESRPMNCVTWYEAMAFCSWDGGYLPTDAEWNFASSGGSQYRVYPWSVPPNNETANNSYSNYYDLVLEDCVGDGVAGCSLNDIARVGSRPLGDGRWGHSDLNGNMREWVLDWYVHPYPTPCNNCAQLGSGDSRVVRGASFADPLNSISGRGFQPPTLRQGGIGFRCGRDPI